MERFSQEQIVKEYGTKAMKQSFKRDGKLTTKQKNTLIKELERRYRKVETEGRPYEFVCSDAYSKNHIQPKEDGRTERAEVPYKKQVEIKTAHMIVKDNHSGKPKSKTSWLKKLDMITEQEQFLLSCYYGEIKGIDWETYVNYAIDNIEGVESENDLTMHIRRIQRLGNHLLDSFQKLNNIKVAQYTKSGMGLIWEFNEESPDGGYYIAIELKSEIWKTMQKIERDTIEKHGILKNERWKINAPNSYEPKILACRDEIKKLLSDVEIDETGRRGVEAVYTAYAIWINYKKPMTAISNILKKRYANTYTEDVKMLKEDLEGYVKAEEKRYHKNRLKHEMTNQDNQVQSVKSQLEKKFKVENLTLEILGEIVDLGDTYKMIALGVWKVVDNVIVDENNVPQWFLGNGLDLTGIKREDGSNVLKWEFNSRFDDKLNSLSLKVVRAKKVIRYYQSETEIPTAELKEEQEKTDKVKEERLQKRMEEEENKKKAEQEQMLNLFGNVIAFTKGLEDTAKEEQLGNIIHGSDPIAELKNAMREENNS